MKEVISLGDLVTSIKGRDSGRVFLVIEVNEGYAFIVDGRVRKILKRKKKKIKHLKKLSTAKLTSLADRIRNGESVGNEKVYRAIKAEKEKIQED